VGEVIIGVVMVTGGLIIATYPIIKLMGWIADGGVEPAAGIVAILLYLGLVAAVMGAPTAGKIVLLLIILVSSILMPLFGQVSDKVQNRQMEDQTFNRFASAVEQDPMNAPARMELARILRKRGELDLAIQHMEWTLERFPRLDFRIKTELDTWKRERERVGIPQPIFCHKCLCENPWNATQCYECGAMFGTSASIKQRIDQEGGPKRVIRGWVVTAAVLNFICFSLIVLPHVLPVEVIGVLIISSVIVGAWLFLRWVGGDMGTVGE
jgi:hypothetical protein